MKLTVLIMILTLATQGCISICGRMSDYGVKPYEPTIDALAIVSFYNLWDDEESADGMEKLVNAVFFFPCLIELPLNFVVDTICLPYDICKNYKDKKELK